MRAQRREDCAVQIEIEPRIRVIAWGGEHTAIWPQCRRVNDAFKQRERPCRAREECCSKACGRGDLAPHLLAYIEFLPPRRERGQFIEIGGLHLENDGRVC